MAISLSIDKQKCIRCGKCSKVCPSLIFNQPDPKSEVEIHHPQTCIVCGHCCAACPTDAVIHGDFPEGKVHTIDYDRFPSPDQLSLLIDARRSNRAVSKEAVPPQALEMIVDAAHRAPTASNMQQVEYTLITNKDVIKDIVDYSMQSIGKLKSMLSNPLLKPFLGMMVPDASRMLPMFDKLIARYEQGGDPILRGFTSLLLIHTPVKNRFGRQDSNLAYQNASLMAESLGVTQFYTGFLCTVFDRDKKGVLAKRLGINGTVHAGMALGMPLFRYPKYIDRKPVKVNHIK